MDTRALSEEEVEQLLSTLPAELPPRPPSPEFEAETWPPVWKARVEESPEYEYGLLQSYLKVEEDIQQYGDVKASNPNVHNNNMLILKFLRIVRESRGYDIDFCPKEFENFPLMPMPFEMLMGDDGYREYLHELTAYVVAKMNARAKMYGQVYEFVEYENVVRAGGHRLELVTFWVKEVSINGGRQVKKVVQAMVESLGGTRFKLFDMRFKPRAEAPADEVGSSGGGAPVRS